MKFQIQLGLFDLRFSGLDRRLCRLVRLYVVVQLALRDGAFFGQRSIPVDIHFGFAELCLSLGQLGIHLVEEGLERAWIDLKKNLPLADERTFFVRLPNDVSCHLWLNLRVDVPVERGNPFAVNRNIFLNHARDFHFGTRNRGRGARSSAGRSQ